MASESVLYNALERIALNHGLQVGSYTIRMTGEYEYLHLGIEKKFHIIGPDKKTILKLVVRLPPSTTDSFVMLPIDNYFFNNVHFYKTVFPLLKSYGFVPTTPKYYGSSLEKNEQYIILEDLEEHGFARSSISTGLSRPQLKLVISTLSNFHHTTRFWKTRKHTEFVSICSEFKPLIGPRYPFKDKFVDYEKLLKIVLEAAWDYLRKANSTEFRRTIEKLIGGLPNRFMKTVEDSVDHTWSTLANCCLWTPNLLFRYHSVSGAPIDVAFVEWCASRLGSPALDLSFVLFASAEIQLYPELGTFLRDYFPQTSSAELMKQVHSYAYYGIYGALFVNVISAFEDSVPLKEITKEYLIDEQTSSEQIPDIIQKILAIIKTTVVIYGS